MAKDINDDDFATAVQTGVTLVDFWAPWCTPCLMLKPVLEELSNEYEGKAQILKLNVDENPQTAQQFSVMSIPTVVVFKDGQAVETFIGVQGKETYSEALNKHLG